jgi:NitT/TauT family transport system permease protein
MSNARTEASTVAVEQKRTSTRRLLLVRSTQLLILGAFLAAWQWVPTIPGARHVTPAFDSFFISSPKHVAQTMYYLATGAHSTPTIWTPLKQSIVPAVLGTLISIVAGALAGLICSTWHMLNRVVRPFIVVANALPRITLIPIVVVIFGATSTADATVAVLVVFFLVFWNAYEGGVSVPQETLENVRILGAGSFQQLRRVRMPYVLVWTFASLPAAIGFGVTVVITAEVLTASTGIGKVLLLSVQNLQPNLTFALALITGFIGLALVGGAEILRKRALHWWY